MQEVIIGFQTGDHILLRVSGIKLPVDTDFYDGNWLPAHIEIKAGAFEGHLSYDIQLRREEFERFLKGLEPMYESLKGNVRFVTMEHWIDFKITGDGRGHFIADGNVIDNHTDGNKLSFVIKFDQTALPETIKGLKSLLNEYPVVGR